MDSKNLESLGSNGDGLFLNPGGFLWCPRDNSFHAGALFASIGQMGGGVGISTNASHTSDSVLKLSYSNKYMSMPESGYRTVGTSELAVNEEWEMGEEGMLKKKKKKGGLKFKIKIGNPSLRRLVSGAIAGAVSRTSVAPLETIRTHLMVGSCGHSTTEVFQDIMKTEGWKGLFRGNLVNVIRVAPSKAIEVKKYNLVIICPILGLFFFSSRLCSLCSGKVTLHYHVT